MRQPDGPERRWRTLRERAHDTPSELATNATQPCDTPEAVLRDVDHLRDPVSRMLTAGCRFVHRSISPAPFARTQAPIVGCTQPTAGAAGTPSASSSAASSSEIRIA